MSLNLDLENSVDAGYLVVTKSSDESVLLFTELGQPQYQYSVRDLSDCLDERETISPHLQRLKTLLVRFGGLGTILQLLDLIVRAHIPYREDGLPSGLESMVKAGSGSTVLVRLPSPFTVDTARLKYLHRYGNSATLKLAGTTYDMSVLSTGDIIRLEFSGESRPLVCGQCKRLMSQMQYRNSHGCSRSRGMSVMPLRFDVVPEVGWPSLIEGVGAALGSAIQDGSQQAPEGLETVWHDLQAAHRARVAAGAPEISPESMVANAVEAWKLLYRVVNERVPPELEVHDIWERVEAIADAVIALGAVRL